MRALLYLLCLLSLSVRADMDMTRELIAPEQMVPGQPARIAITFWTDSWFNPPPEWPEMAIEYGMLLPTPVPNQLVSRNQGGTSWSGIRMERQVMGWGDGTLRFPALDVTLVSANQPPKTVHLAALEKRVSWPAGVEQPDRFLPASALQLNQKWVVYRSQADTQLHVGDVIERQLTVQAKGVVAAQIPPLLFAIPGHGMQKLTPVSRPLTEGRGDIVGVIREERLRYLPDTAGTLTLPAVKLRWWDTTQGQWQLSEVPGATYTLAPARSGGSENALRGEHPDRPWLIAAWGVAGILLAIAMWLLRHPLQRSCRYLQKQILRRWRVIPLPDLVPNHRKE